MKYMHVIQRPSIIHSLLCFAKVPQLGGFLSADPFCRPSLFPSQIQWAIPSFRLVVVFCKKCTFNPISHIPAAKT
jgi:hypothetical protein